MGVKYLHSIGAIIWGSLTQSATTLNIDSGSSLENFPLPNTLVASVPPQKPFYTGILWQAYGFHVFIYIVQNSMQGCQIG